MKGVIKKINVKEGEQVPNHTSYWSLNSSGYPLPRSHTGEIYSG